ncbi:ubiquitin-specific protease UBP8 KNAG_0G02930 [Huiozyma naganishii CBS 8797]|uniref:Ubiquitin carboxyl-terminal hydrolase n=1 Tax=Huiozyma naganishii (strain ATCC MYA-139 / BCRC 22969 / CBS 8797 / KCTC 17520 / NBRC 10181 / NCYC 3082 / Yp74L-3) TaxID=1071383 RepID=J7R902_HUIN7|nr:hypothetical protein KNAG_0G02930 [Kazachstania naganishii CBS 8797]CCK71350.1 hypothetical protein KNAG_0G02930 [Kazachstania naganishii CBS 8797]
MSSCKHIDLVLADDLERDRFLGEYAAVKRFVLRASTRDKLQCGMTCHTCREVCRGATFICLSGGCTYVGCWNGGHFQEHTQGGHRLGVNAQNGLVFCFECVDYVAGCETLDIAGVPWDSAMSKQVSLPTSLRRDGLYGLLNLGSTCFMSSILQSLIHNTYIQYWFLNSGHARRCALRDPSSCISCALDRIISECYGSLSERNDHAGFLSLLTCSWKINQNFAGYSQQDAHEFLQFLLNQLHCDYKRERQVDEDKEVRSSSSQLCHCIVHSSFQGTLRSSIVCPECQDDSKTMLDPFLDLSLDIKGQRTLYDCLDSFHRREQLHDFDYHCPRCQTSRDPIKQLTIERLAPTLVLQLKRFEHLTSGQNVKLNDPVQFPLHLDMSRYCTGGEPTTSIVYRLSGVVSHSGTVNEGHYTAVLQLNSGEWFKFNDSMISVVSAEDVLREQAYLLLYTVEQVAATA